MTKNRLNSLAILILESEMTRMLENDDLIDSFVSKKVRKKSSYY